MWQVIEHCGNETWKSPESIRVALELIEWIMFNSGQAGRTNISVVAGKDNHSGKDPTLALVLVLVSVMLPNPIVLVLLSLLL